MILWRRIRRILNRIRIRTKKAVQGSVTTHTKSLDALEMFRFIAKMCFWRTVSQKSTRSRIFKKKSEAVPTNKVSNVICSLQILFSRRFFFLVKLWNSNKKSLTFFENFCFQPSYILDLSLCGLKSKGMILSVFLAEKKTRFFFEKTQRCWN